MRKRLTVATILLLTMLSVTLCGCGGKGRDKRAVENKDYLTDVERYYSDNGEMSLEIFTDYYDNGSLKNKTLHIGDIVCRLEYDEPTAPNTDTKVVSYSIAETPDGYQHIKYDDNWRVIYRLETDNNDEKTIAESEFTYDNKGNLIKEKQTINSVDYVSEYEYDKYNVLIKKTISAGNAPGEDMVSRYEYDYDEKGYPAIQYEYLVVDDSEILSTTTKYTRDDNNLITSEETTYIDSGDVGVVEYERSLKE